MPKETIATSKNTKRVITILLIVVIGFVLAGLVYLKTQKDYEQALQSYKTLSKIEAEEAGQKVSDSFKQIYQGIRTLSLLPSIKTIDCCGKNLDGNARETIIQIYNNLASNVSISEVYIVPVTLDPEHIDPRTSSLQAPILMFDDIVVSHQKGEGKEDEVHITSTAQAEREEEVEIYEYRLLKEQMNYLKQYYPNQGAIKGLDVPFIGGHEVLTCDNTEYSNTNNDSDRKGIVLSVPFYGPTGELKGTVTAVIRNNIIRKVIPEDNYVLINTTYDYQIAGGKSALQPSSSDWIRAGKADPHLLYSEVLPIATSDPRANWALWVGHVDKRFLESEGAQSVKMFSQFGYSFAALFTIVGLIVLELSYSNFKTMQAAGKLLETHNAELESKVSERAAEIHRMLEVQELERRQADAHAQEEREQAVRKQEALIEKELSEIIHACIHGDFSKRLDTTNRFGLLLTLSQALNQISELCHTSISELKLCLQSLSEGNLTRTMQGKFHGVFAEIQQSLNATLENLTVMVEQIQSTADSVMGASHDMIANGHNLADRTDKQAKMLRKTAVSMLEMTESVQKNAMGAHKTNHLAKDAQTAVEDGRAAVTDVASSMIRINNSSHKVAEIMAVIDGIAFQTNLLSLNAAVEAARVGEEGRGFAVVASEVRALAVRSAEASKEIKRMILENIATVSHGAELATKAESILDKIVDTVLNNAEIAAEISQSSEKQSAEIAEVNKGVAQLEKITEENVVMSENSLSTAEKMSAKADELRSLTQTFKTHRNH